MNYAILRVGRRRRDAVHHAAVVPQRDVAVGVVVPERVPVPTEQPAAVLLGLHGLSTSRPRCRRDSSPRTIHVPAAASPRFIRDKSARRVVSTDYLRPSRGVAAIHHRHIRAASRLHGLSTSQPRRRRDSSETYPRGERTPAAARAPRPRPGTLGRGPARRRGPGRSPARSRAPGVP